MYFKLLMHLPALDILVHRVIWSALVLALMLLFAKQFRKVSVALGSAKVLFMLFCSGLLLLANWLLFIWAVNNDRLLDASLGYYINPLLNVLLGYLFLQERLGYLQKIAVGVAATGVLVLVISFGQVPWIALSLAITFGIYGLLRKQVAIDSLPGLFIETAMMLPFALVYWVWFASDLSSMATNHWQLNFTLICAGIVTTAPLLCFTAAARRIQYSTLGFFQYIGPSTMFLLAVFLYQEPFDQVRLFTFVCVWSALLIFSFESIRRLRHKSGQ